MQTDKVGKRIGKRAWPLRKVVKENIPGIINGIQFSRTNLLECGHHVVRSTDIYGETSPVKQRCGTCYRMNLPNTP